MSETAAPAASLAAPTVTRDQPPIDITALGELLGDSDPEFLRQILAAFIATMEGTPAMLSALAAGDDADALTNEAHSAKGAAASACAEELCELCRKLEHAGRNENWPEIRRLAPLIAGEFDNIRRFINNELSDRSLERIT